MLPADSTPLVSCSTTVKVSPVVVPVSPRLTPVIAPALPTPSASVVGAATCGLPFTVTAIVSVGALLPNPSVAFSVIVSPVVAALVSVSVPSALSTAANPPLIVRLVALLVATVTPSPPVAARTPAVSETVTDRCSLVVLPFSLMARAGIVAVWPTPTTTFAGAAKAGRAFTVTASVFCAAVMLVLVSVAFRVIVSAVPVATVSATVPSALVICASVPASVNVAVPEPLTPVPLAVRSPLAEASVMEKGSVLGAFASARVMPPSAPDLPMPITSPPAGVPMTGPFSTVSVMVF